MELLLEVVRLAPNAADPYRTLGNIYEVKGDPRKALHFFMIAAHLPPKVPSRLATPRQAFIKTVVSSVPSECCTSSCTFC